MPSDRQRRQCRSDPVLGVHLQGTRDRTAGSTPTGRSNLSKRCCSTCTRSLSEGAIRCICWVYGDARRSTLCFGRLMNGASSSTAAGQCGLSLLVRRRCQRRAALQSLRCGGARLALFQPLAPLRSTCDAVALRPARGALRIADRICVRRALGNFVRGGRRCGGRSTNHLALSYRVERSRKGLKIDTLQSSVSCGKGRSTKRFTGKSPSAGM